MTISLTNREFLEQFQEADKEELNFDPLDELDIVLKHSGRFAQGWRRHIQLREGILLLIGKEQNRERLLVENTEYAVPLSWHFMLSGKQKFSYSSFSHKQTDIPLHAGRYISATQGLIDWQIEDCLDTEPFIEVHISVQPTALRSFISDSSGELPKIFNHLVGSPNRRCYKRLGETSPIVTAILQQIIQCPYQGLTKRMYLEGKTTELMALMLEEEAAVQQGEFKTSLLQPDLLERIHHVKEILLKDLKKSPSLEELAQQVGTCDYNLKRGFKEVFGTTVYGYLRDRRLEKAQQLLLDGQMSVASVASAVGYDSRSSFYTAFKQKYGVSPKAYQMSVRK